MEAAEVQEGEVQEEEEGEWKEEEKEVFAKKQCHQQFFCWTLFYRFHCIDSIVCSLAPALVLASAGDKTCVNMDPQ